MFLVIFGGLVGFADVLLERRDYNIAWIIFEGSLGLLKKIEFLKMFRKVSWVQG